MNLNRSIFGIYHPVHKASLLACDLLAIALTFFVASNIRLNSSPNILSLEYLGLNLIIIASLFIGGAYTSSSIGSAPKLPLNTFFTALASSIPSVLFIYFLGPERFTALLGRGVYPFAIIGFATIAVSNRYLLNRAFHQQESINKILLLGSLETKVRVEKLLSLSQIKAHIVQAASVESLSHDIDQLDALVIAPNHALDEQEQQRLVNLRLSGLPIFSLSDFFESFLFLVPVQEIDNDWFIRAEGFTMLHSSISLRVKRATDILISVLLLTLTVPLTIITALLIKLTSRGSVFFSQTRVGLMGKPFTLYKFRTMKTDAESDGAQWAIDDDPRIIPIGKFLRKSRIDEIPQCLNILKGEMSIIGPRPERPEFTAKLAHDIPYYDLRHVIKPGLTGWAQVRYPYGASIDDALKKLQFDLYYIKNYSLLLDLNILLRTVRVTLTRRGR